MKMVKTGLIIILLLNFFKDNRSENSSCRAYQDSGNENIPIREGMIKLWAACLKEYNTSRIHTIDEIYHYLKIVSRSPDGHVKLQNLTLKDVRARNTAITVMGNYIPYLNISIGSYVQKPAIVIVGGIFARDWLTIAAAVHIIEELVLHYKTHMDILGKCSWIIVPVLNPDGYEETLTDGRRRNWVKNMRKVGGSNEMCFGVNLFMNFEYQWLNYNYENISKCDDEFSVRPFSESESRSLRDTIAINLDSVKMFVTLIQRGRNYSYPFSFTPVKPLNYSIFENILMQSTQKAHSLYHRQFHYGHASKFENKLTAGGPSDWIKAHFQVEMAFTCGISYVQSNFATLRSTEIEKTNKETFVAMKTIASLGTDYVEGKLHI